MMKIQFFTALVTILFCLPAMAQWPDRHGPTLDSHVAAEDAKGLPTEWSEFSKNPEPRFPVDDMSYEAYDPETETVIEDIFLAGWSRKASDGLVGAARKDGTNGSKAVLQYLEQLGPAASLDTQALHDRLAALDKYVVRNEDYGKLMDAENRHQCNGKWNPFRNIGKPFKGICTLHQGSPEQCCNNRRKK